MTEHCSTDSSLRDFCDGSLFKEQEFFRQYPTALQIFLYYDDLEICNPLGSNVKKHKLGHSEIMFLSFFTVVL